MKKLIALLAAMAIAGSISAQNKTAYLDLYQRGGAMHLKTTLIFNNRPVYLGKKNLGEVLNMLAESGWEIDKTLNVRRGGKAKPSRPENGIIFLRSPLPGMDAETLLALERPRGKITRPASLPYPAKG